jgi:hypothetical protein
MATVATHHQHQNSVKNKPFHKPARKKKYRMWEKISAVNEVEQRGLM